MVKYCNAACKKKHRQKHKKACERRVAELHDEKLFKQLPPNEDCPICFLRLPTLEWGQTYMVCCSKIICSGCVHAPVYDDKGNEIDNQRCPFCRTPPPFSDEEMIKRYKKRMELNDVQAIYNFGGFHYSGNTGFPQNYSKAIKFWHRAGELGSAEAYYGIGILYDRGIGVEVDMIKAQHYFEIAAKRGNVYARLNLGAYEMRRGNMGRALKHWMIAVRDGEYKSLQNIKSHYLDGHATKEDYEKALRSYQAYLDEIKSEQREAAAVHNDTKYYESAS